MKSIPELLEDFAGVETLTGADTFFTAGADEVFGNKEKEDFIGEETGAGADFLTGAGVVVFLTGAGAGLEVGNNLKVDFGAEGAAGGAGAGVFFPNKSMDVCKKEFSIKC